MKSVLVLLFVGIVAGDKLPNTYVPAPANAVSAAGGFYVQAPTTTPTPYVHPTQVYEYNNQGQPATVHIGYNRPSNQYYQQQQYQQPIYQRPSQPQYQPQSNYNSGYYGHGSSHQNENPFVRYENVNNGDGNYRFDFVTVDGISHNQEGHINNPGTNQQENVVKGSYSYTGPDGKVYTVNYWADATGYHATGDHLPTPPPIPEAIAKSLAARGQLPSYSQNQYQQQPQQYGSGGYYQGQQHPQPQQYVPPRTHSGYY